MHAIKTFSIKMHEQCFVYKSSKFLLKFRDKRLSECSCSLRAAKRKGDGLWEIRTYRAPHTSINPIMNRDHRQLDVEAIQRHAYVTELLDAVKESELPHDLIWLMPFDHFGVDQENHGAS